MFASISLTAEPQQTIVDSRGTAVHCHPSSVLTWFKDIPRMSGYSRDNYRNVQRAEVLETICYSAPVIASFQDRWEKIRVKQDGARITVDAVGRYLARGHSGQFRYRTTYKIEGHSISIVAHETFPTKPDKSEPGDEDDAAE